MEKKLLVFDVDGTLVGDDQVLHEDVINILNDLLKKGHVIAIASGRPYVGIKYFMDKLTSGEKYCICANGSEVTDINGNTLFMKSIELHEYYEFLSRHQDIFNHEDTNIYCYTHKHIAYLKNDLWIDLECDWNKGFPSLDLTKNKLKDNHPLLKFMISTKDPNYSSYIENNLILDLEKKKYQIIRTSPYFLEFINKMSDKAVGVSFLKDYLNIKKDNVYTFGDSGNDYLMIKEFNGVAMGNAMKECKDVASFVTINQDEGGLIYAIKNYVKI